MSASRPSGPVSSRRRWRNCSERQRLQELEAQLTARAGDDAARGELRRDRASRRGTSRPGALRPSASPPPGDGGGRGEVTGAGASRDPPGRDDHRQQEMAEAEPEQEPVAGCADRVTGRRAGRPEVVDLDALHETEEKEPAPQVLLRPRGVPGPGRGRRRSPAAATTSTTSSRLLAGWGFPRSARVRLRVDLERLTADPRRLPPEEAQGEKLPEQTQAIITPSRQTIDPSISMERTVHRRLTTGPSGAPSPPSAARPGRR